MPDVSKSSSAASQTTCRIATEMEYSCATAFADRPQSISIKGPVNAHLGKIFGGDRINMRIQTIAVKILLVCAVSAVFPVLAQNVEPKPTCNLLLGGLHSPERAGRVQPASHRTQSCRSAGALGGYRESTGRDWKHLPRKAGPGHGRGEQKWRKRWPSTSK